MTITRQTSVQSDSSSSGCMTQTTRAAFLQSGSRGAPVGLRGAVARTLSSLQPRCFHQRSGRHSGVVHEPVRHICRVSQRIRSGAHRMVGKFRAAQSGNLHQRLRGNLPRRGLTPAAVSSSSSPAGLHGRGGSPVAFGRAKSRRAETAVFRGSRD